MGRLIRRTGLALVGCMMAIPAGSPARAVPSHPLIIAEVCPTTGRFALHCEDDRRGAEMAISEFNAHGGVLGRPIVLVSADPTLNPAHAARVARALIATHRIGFMVGALDSGVAASMSAVCQKHGMIFINTNSSAPSESVGHAHRTKFVFDANAANFNRALLGYALSRHKDKRVVLLTENDVWGRSSARASRRIIAKDGGTIVGEVVVPETFNDPAAALRKIAAIPADIVAVNISGDNQIRLFSQIDPKILRKQSWVVGEVDWEELYPAPGTPRPLYGITWAWNLDTPGTATFTARYRKIWGHTLLAYPGDVYHAAYFATKALLQAIQRAGTTDNRAVIRQLEQWKWSATQRMQKYGAYMDPVSHHLQQTIYIATWRPNLKRPQLGQHVLSAWSPQQVFYPPETTTKLESLASIPDFAP